MSDETTIQPALNAEEWAHRQFGEAFLVLTDGSCGSRHAIAALALYGQPFGFTHEDVEVVHSGVLALRESDCLLLADELQTVLNRLAALLPPAP